MEADLFHKKHLDRKIKIRLLIRAYRKNSFNSNKEFSVTLLDQIAYMRCYCDLVEGLHDLLFHQVGVVKLRDLISTIYKSLNEVLFKPLSILDMDSIQKVSKVDVHDRRLLSDRADIFTSESLERVISLSNEILKRNSERIIPITR